MTDQRTNQFGQPIGPGMSGWAPCPRPTGETLGGRLTRLEPLRADRHAVHLFEANSQDDDRMWTYMSVGPFADLQTYRQWVESVEASTDPFFYAIIDKTSDHACGVATLMRIKPEHGVIETGNIAYSPALQGTIQATEAMYLLMRHVFDDLVYRRYEWKCDHLNAPSRRAALRLGFKFEGIFPQHVIYKGRSRDTAWFSMLDDDWPPLKAAFQAWLAPENFSTDGKQIRRLSEMTKANRL